ncbi:MAG: alpha-ketoacid dehydrogenase subunit beta [Propylenella sp.]
MPVQRFADALVDALHDSLSEDPKVTLIGSYVLGLGPLRHLMDRVRNDFPGRVSDPPTAEAGAAATAVGAAMAGMRPFVDLGTASFSYLAWSQVVNEAAVARYMSNGILQVPVTFHYLAGIRGGGASQHSNSPQAMMSNAPGLEIIAPSNAADVYGLVRTALRSPNPTVIVSHAKLLAMEGEVPEKKSPIPFGEAAVVRAGTDVSIVANSLMVHHAIAAADELAAERVSVEVVDLRTIVPLDEEAILATLARTGRLVVVDECPLRCGIASDIAGMVAEQGFDLLKARVRRVARPNVPVPYSPALEAAVAPNKARIVEAVRTLL